MQEEIDRGKRLKNPGYVYIFRSGTSYKIGQSINPRERLDKLNRIAYCGRTNWVFIEAFQTDWMLQSEQSAHMELYSFNIKKEIFSCTLEQARNAVIQSITKYNLRFKEGHAAL